MTRKPLVKIAIVDRNQLFRESIVEFLSLNGYQIILQLADKTDLLKNAANAVIPDVCLMQLSINECSIGECIKSLRANWPTIKIILYSIELELDIFEVPLFGADAVLTNSTSLIELERVLELETVENEI